MVSCSAAPDGEPGLNLTRLPGRFLFAWVAVAGGRLELRLVRLGAHLALHQAQPRMGTAGSLWGLAMSGARDA
jgi:hypothetical protein